MKETVIHEIIDRLEGYKNEPTWEVISFEKHSDGSYVLQVQKVGDLEKKSELQDIVEKLSSYDGLFYATSISPCYGNAWKLIVCRNEDVNENNQ